MTTDPYLKRLKEGFESAREMSEAKLELAQSMRDRGSRDQEEAARALREVAAELRERNPDNPMIEDMADTMELAATLERSND